MIVRAATCTTIAHRFTQATSLKSQNQLCGVEILFKTPKSRTVVSRYQPSSTRLAYRSSCSCWSGGCRWFELKICWFYCGIFSRSSAIIFRASDFTFGLFCFLRAGPSISYSPWLFCSCDRATAVDVQTVLLLFPWQLPLENGRYVLLGDTHATFTIPSTRTC